MITMAVLDMGGTTVQENGVVLEAFDEALRGAGLTGGRLRDGLDRAEQTMGQSKIEVFRTILDSEEAARSANLVFEASLSRRIAAGDLRPIPGAEEAMLTLKRAGILVVLATGFAPATRDLLLKRLGWTELPDLVTSGDQWIRGRPHPDMILDAIVRLHVEDVRHVAVAGDTVNDLLSGHRAGAGAVVGVLTGAHDRTRLAAVPHTHIIETIAELPAVLL